MVEATFKVRNEKNNNHCLINKHIPYLFSMFIYIQRHPGTAENLVQSMFIICDAARKFQGISWRNYDKQFRIQQAISCQGWLKLNSDLLWGLIAVRVPLKPESSHAAAQVLTQTGVCFSDNRGHCNAAECRHLHLCSISVRGCTRNGAAQNTIIFAPKKTSFNNNATNKNKKN